MSNDPRTNALENGLTLLQVDPDYAADLQPGSKYRGWLFWHHPDGQWVTHRKLEDWEYMQAEDQRDAGIVINGGQS